jgi:hypothetical protein
MKILDLSAAIESFIESKSDPFGQGYRDADKLVIQAIDDHDMPDHQRIETIRNWWGRYSVSRNLREGEHNRVAREVLAYADHRNSRKLAEKSVSAEFLVLQDRMKNARHAANRDRVIDSLCSKTLWFCYPHSVPMLDGNAEGAIRVISRLCGFPTRTKISRYADFVAAWFEGYNRVSAKIPTDKEHPYAVRVFDAFLWWLGQGTFEAPNG